MLRIMQALVAAAIVAIVAFGVILPAINGLTAALESVGL